MRNSRVLAVYAIVICLPIFASAQEPTHPSDFVSILDLKFHEYKFGNISRLPTQNTPESCLPFNRYSKIEDRSAAALHGDQTLSLFAGSALQVIPLQLHDPSQVLDATYLVHRFVQAFECLNDLAKKPGYRGSNISVGLKAPNMEALIARIADFEALHAHFMKTATTLLRKAPNAFLTIALGNDHQRTEHLTTFPSLDLCSLREIIPNLFCVTGYHSPRQFSDQSAFTKPIQLENLVYNIKAIPDGTTKHPFPIAFRFGSTPNIIAVSTYKRKPTTSFLAPILLKALVENPEIHLKKNFVIAPNLKMDALEVYRIRTFELY